MSPATAPKLSEPHARRGLRGKVLVLAVTLGVAALGIALATVFTRGARHAHVGRSASVAGKPLTVLIDSHHPGKQVRPRFIGLSFEVAALPEFAALADSGNIVGLLRSLGPGVLRFGGVSADTQVAWTDAATPRPAWAPRVLDSRDLRRLGRIASSSGWSVLLTVGLAHYEPMAAAREVAAAKAALGGRLAAIEIGNEPDAYAQHQFRSSPWTFARYDAEVGAYRRAIARAAPGVRFAGPGVSGSQIFVTWGAGEALAQRPVLLTGHHYPLGCHQNPAPSIGRLLSIGVRKLEGQSLGRFMSVSHSSRIPFRLDEINSVSCGGTAGISNAFASALWATGYLAEAMAAGVSGINMQGNPINCRGYSPLCAATARLFGSGVLHPQPDWYALLLSKSLIGSRPLPTTISTPGSPNVLAQAFKTAGGSLRLVIVDDEPPGAHPAVLRLQVGRSYRWASVLSLRAPGPAASTGVTLGGRAVARDGSWHARPRVTPLVRRGGAITLTVPASSAALVTLLRAPAAAGR
ncbi:MAG TPA: glycosyl hydrolase family 79 C-terminal domain-containing protein [Solirubrobacteraceae bacterium]|nr:glycosyl hydrolase family 79 C-terminal domain-containing protein [Solirubrobacteraceae bacterium]